MTQSCPPLPPPRTPNDQVWHRASATGVILDSKVDSDYDGHARDTQSQYPLSAYPVRYSTFRDGWSLSAMSLSHPYTASQHTDGPNAYTPSPVSVGVVDVVKFTPQQAAYAQRHLCVVSQGVPVQQPYLERDHARSPGMVVNGICFCACCVCVDVCLCMCESMCVWMCVWKCAWM
jgi:hypothetical protein